VSATFLGIDVGSTRTKAVVLGAEGSTALAAAAAPTPQGAADGVAVHVPEAIRGVVVDTARRALAEAGPDRKSVV
jgi:xylulokinase